MPWLWVFPPGAGPGEGQAVALPPGGLRLGREGDNDLVLEDGGTSRHHARIQAEAGGWIIEDLGSANGTWIGDLRVQRQRVAAGVYFRLGETRLVIVDEAAPATEQGAGPATEPAAGPARVGREVSGLAPAPAARRKGRLGLALLAATALGFAAALALAGGLVAESRDPRLLPSQLASLVRNGWSGRLRPAPLPVSGTAALDARPHAALRLRAPAGALDRFPAASPPRPLGWPGLGPGQPRAARNAAGGGLRAGWRHGGGRLLRGKGADGVGPGAPRRPGRGPVPGCGSSSAGLDDDPFCRPAWKALGRWRSCATMASSSGEVPQGASPAGKRSPSSRTR